MGGVFFNTPPMHEAGDDNETKITNGEGYRTKLCILNSTRYGTWDKYHRELLALYTYERN
jgi:hypothetical protein